MRARSRVDRGLALYFPAPHSYTGEDVLELHAHGGAVVLQLLVARCLEAAAEERAISEHLGRCDLRGPVSSPRAHFSTASSTWRRPRRWPT